MASGTGRNDATATLEHTMATPKTLTPNEMLAAIARLEKENAALKAQPVKTNVLTIKLSDKSPGVVSVYGLGRFPVSLYREQWERLLAIAPDVQKFIEVNRAKLPSKAEKAAAAPSTGAVAAPGPSGASAL